MASASPPFEEEPTYYDDGSARPSAGPEVREGDTPRRKRAGRQSLDNVEENKVRHEALYQYYKSNPHMSQMKLAEWYTSEYETTMSQCSVSQILKRQKVAHGETVEEPKPRPGKRKSLKTDELLDETKPTKKGRKSLEGKADGILIPPSSSMPALSYTPGFQPVNSAQAAAQSALSFSHYREPTNTVVSPRNFSQPFTTPGRQLQASTPAPTSAQPRYQPPAHHQAHFQSQPSTVNGSSYHLDEQSQASSSAPVTMQQLQTELDAARRTVDEYIKIASKQESLIDNVLKNQRDDRERIRVLDTQLDALRAENDALKSENKMLKDGSTDDQLKDLMGRNDSLKRALEREQESNRLYLQTLSEEDAALKELMGKRSQRFPLGVGMARS